MGGEVAQTRHHCLLGGSHSLEVRTTRKEHDGDLAGRLLEEEEPIIFEEFVLEPELVDGVQQEHIGTLEGRRDGVGGDCWLGGRIDIDEVGDVMKEQLDRQNTRGFWRRCRAEVEQLRRTGTLRIRAQLPQTFEQTEHVELEGSHVDGVLACGNGASREELGVQGRDRWRVFDDRDIWLSFDGLRRAEHVHKLFEGERRKESRSERNARQVVLQEDRKHVKGRGGVHAHHRDDQFCDRFLVLLNRHDCLRYCTTLQPLPIIVPVLDHFRPDILPLERKHLLGVV